jgi:hypothetical protein
MNLASKLGEDLAKGKETLMTASAFNELPDSIKRRCSPVDPGTATFKVQIYRLNGVHR